MIRLLAPGWVSFTLTWIICVLTFFQTERLLRCWLFSCLEYTQARLYFDHFPWYIKAFCLYTMDVKGFFRREKIVLFFLHELSIVLPLLESIAWLTGSRGSIALRCLDFIFFLLCVYCYFFRIKGVDGRRHAPFNVYAALPTIAKRKIQTERRQMTFGQTFGWWMNDDQTTNRISGNTLRDEKLLALFHRL